MSATTIAPVPTVLPAAMDQQPSSPAAVDTAVVVVVVVSGGRALIGRRADATPPWTLLGGKIEPGESAAAAAVREVWEESGLQVTVTAELGERVHPTTGRRLVYLAAVPAHDTTVQALDPAITELRWVLVTDLDLLLPDLFAPVQRWLAHAHALALAEPAKPSTGGCRR